MGPLGAAEAYYVAYLAWAHAQIATGNPQATRPYLARQLALAEAHGLTGRVIELSLLQALAARTARDEAGTWPPLERALVVAEPAGYLRIFDQGPHTTRLLIAAAERGVCRAYVGRILSAIGVPPAIDALTASSPASRFAPCPESGERLSERELEVLRLIAQGASNHEIAERLVITVGTVKSHVNHILGKLAAHNRTEAVARARSAGLLDI